MTKIFVSYSHVDSTWVHDTLAPLLSAGGATVLIDKVHFSVGTSIDGQMDYIQDQADLSILCISHAYLVSSRCRHEMMRAIAQDPDFSRSLRGGNLPAVIPILINDALIPTQFTKYDPLFVRMNQGNNDEAWNKIFAACRINLGTTASIWLRARDRIRTAVGNGVSINLCVNGRGIAWKPLLNEVAGSNLGFAWIDLQNPATITRAGLIKCILTELGYEKPIARGRQEIEDFSKYISSRHSPARFVLLHSDLIPHKSYKTDIDLFITLRWLVCHKYIVIILHSHAEFQTLIPKMFSRDDYRFDLEEIYLTPRDASA